MSVAVVFVEQLAARREGLRAVAPFAGGWLDPGPPEGMCWQSRAFDPQGKVFDRGRLTALVVECLAVGDITSGGQARRTVSFQSYIGRHGALEGIGISRAGRPSACRVPELGLGA